MNDPLNLAWMINMAASGMYGFLMDCSLICSPTILVYATRTTISQVAGWVSWSSSRMVQNTTHWYSYFSAASSKTFLSTCCFYIRAMASIYKVWMITTKMVSQIITRRVSSNLATTENYRNKNVLTVYPMPFGFSLWKSKAITKVPPRCGRCLALWIIATILPPKTPYPVTPMNLFFHQGNCHPYIQ